MSSAYTNEAQQRILKLVDLLFGHEIDGVSPGQLGKSLGVTGSKITRDLANLQEAGWAETLPGDGVSRWRIAPRVGSRALATLQAFDSAEHALQALRARYQKPP